MVRCSCCACRWLSSPDRAPSAVPLLRSGAGPERTEPLSTQSPFRRLSLAGLLALPGLAQEPQPAVFDHSHAAFTAVLSAHVKGDRVDYLELQKERTGLDAYLASLGAVGREEFEVWSRAQQFAFWIDAYNAYTLALVIDHYPVTSMRKIGKPKQSVWDLPFVPLHALHPDPRLAAGGPLSLNQIEHEILREGFEDARVHAAVHSGSRGCPPILAEAFVAEHLDDQLDAAVRSWLADPTRNRFDEKQRTLHLSKIFDWFGADFVRDGESVAGWVARYAPEKASVWIRAEGKLKLRYLEYSWELNDLYRPKDRPKEQRDGDR